MQATRSFDTILTVACLDNLKINVNITKGQNIKDLVFHLVQLHAIPPYITTSLISSISNTMTELNKLDTTTVKKDKGEQRHLFMDAYQSNTLQYNNKPEEVSFKNYYFA